MTFAAGTYCFQQVRGGSLFQPHQGFQGTFEQTFFFFASCLLYYRAGMFIHEVVHQRTTGRLAGFRFVWNLLCGIPFLIHAYLMAVVIVLLNSNRTIGSHRWFNEGEPMTFLDQSLRRPGLVLAQWVPGLGERPV